MTFFKQNQGGVGALFLGPFPHLTSLGVVSGRRGARGEAEKNSFKNFPCLISQFGKKLKKVSNFLNPFAPRGLIEEFVAYEKNADKKFIQGD